MRFSKLVPRRVPLIASLVTSVGVVLVCASTASAVTLAGDWAPFTRCPVNDPTMLATNNPACLASDSPAGSIKLGNTTATTGDSNLQLGLPSVHGVAFDPTIATPRGGALDAASVNVPGGLLGLMCPSNVPLVTLLCNQATNNLLNKLTAVLKPAGNPSNFNLFAGLSPGKPIVTLPVKIQLQNPLLGSNCYLGSNSRPILLRPQTLVPGAVSAQSFDANGTPDSNGVLDVIRISGATQGDSSFAVPGASGCGGSILAPLLDAAIDAKDGLPSPSGSNSLTLRNATASIAEPAKFGSMTGRTFASDWESAVRP
jgi:hypothetical protein